MTIIDLFSIFFFLELFFIIIIFFLKSKKIPWIITSKDKTPTFSKVRIDEFIKKKFNYHLGWDWKKPRSKITNKEKIASFGDSFVYCRYSSKNKTWQSIFKKKTKLPIINYGVGNHGLDQILLKYEKTKLPKSVKYIIIGFVPETLSRCLSSWRHYYEFNNIFGFKPRFKIKKGNLIKISNPIKDVNSFSNIGSIISKLQIDEFFFKKRFMKYCLSFPYSFSFIKNFNYNFHLFLNSFLYLFGINKNRLFDFIISRNCLLNDSLYNNKEYKKLIRKMIKEFYNIAKKRRHKIKFIIFPQKYDLISKNYNCETFFNKILKKGDLLNLKEKINFKNYEMMYLESQFGAHLNYNGNKKVSELLIEKLNAN